MLTKTADCKLTRAEFLKLARQRMKLTRKDVRDILYETNGITLYETQLSRYEGGARTKSIHNKNGDTSCHLTLTLARQLAFVYGINVDDIP